MSTGLTVCYSLRLFYFVLCGDFNFVLSYCMVETSYNMMFGMTGLLVMSIFGGGKHHPKHVELTRNNKLTCIVASCWSLL